MPDKFHGLQDREARYRQRYLDLISNDESVTPSKPVRNLAGIRQFMVARGFMEVERADDARGDPGQRLPVRLSPITTRWIWTCTCVSRAGTVPQASGGWRLRTRIRN